MEAKMEARSLTAECDGPLLLCTHAAQFSTTNCVHHPHFGSFLGHSALSQQSPSDPHLPHLTAAARLR